MKENLHFHHCLFGTENFYNLVTHWPLHIVEPLTSEDSRCTSYHFYGPCPLFYGYFWIRNYLERDFKKNCVHTHRIRIVLILPNVSDTYPDISRLSSTVHVHYQETWVCDKYKQHLCLFVFDMCCLEVMKTYYEKYVTIRIETNERQSRVIHLDTWWSRVSAQNH